MHSTCDHMHAYTRHTHARDTEHMHHMCTRIPHVITHMHTDTGHTPYTGTYIPHVIVHMYTYTRHTHAHMHTDTHTHMHTDKEHTHHIHAHGHRAHASCTGTCIPHTHHTCAHGHTPHTRPQHTRTASFPRPGRKWPRPQGGPGGSSLTQLPCYRCHLLLGGSLVSCR